ncbi:MAG: 3-oxoacyl-ACP reductase [Pelagibacterales bacterium]|nr:3-oxoacyl-ACP reductase [Pelagibacterales bacterium]OUU62237.1 MAG: 3-oxoacyl-ACP reductase [Alphaproteobacteria bacterium TMED62]|tara:strand:+ start:443 stop:1225 length:783 start_codon:yes stop_codon:yes gene_type:complete
MRLKKKINNNKKVAIVTGAGSGIGKAVALGLAKEGVDIYLAGRKKKKLLITKQQSIKENNRGKCYVIKCDVSKEIDVRKLFLLLHKQYGRLDLLFNNAGIGIESNTIDKIKFKDWKKVIDINVNGMFLCAKYAYQLMKKQKLKGGRIINNGSISAFTPRPGTAAYTTSKHAITGLTKSIALDGREDNILCSQIDIGNADTAITQSFKKGISQPNGKVLKEPTIDVEDVVKAVLTIFKLPLDTNILNLTIMANKMPFIGRG